MRPCTTPSASRCRAPFTRCSRRGNSSAPPRRRSPPSKTNLAIAKKRLDGGTLLKTDVLDLEVRLAQAREDLVRARNANALAVRALRNLLGIEEGEFEVADTVAHRQRPGLG